MVTDTAPRTWCSLVFKCPIQVGGTYELRLQARLHYRNFSAILIHRIFTRKHPAERERQRKDWKLQCLCGKGRRSREVLGERARGRTDVIPDAEAKTAKRESPEHTPQRLRHAQL